MTDTAPPNRIAQRLARLGFLNAASAGDQLAELGLWDAATNRPADDGAASIVSALGRSADPDGAVQALSQMNSSDPTLLTTLCTDKTLRGRLIPLLGSSLALADHLSAHASDWRVLLDGDERPAPFATVGNDIPALRAAYRRELVAIAGRDLAGDLEIDAVMLQLSELAAELLRAALAIAEGALPASAPQCRLAVIAMGKTGGRELNYVSDVDVVFVAEPGADATEQGALTTAASLAAEMMRICASAAWPVDAALRPEGKAGPLVRTLASHETYYRRWASTWEFQALLKARPVAGDDELGQKYVEAITPLVWTAADRPNFVADVQAMRRRVLAQLPQDVAEREIKLGSGGLRDVEFAVQLLQLVHGRADESLQVGGTLPALAALRDGGYVGVDDSVSLIDAYRFLRAVEHRLQLRRLRRTHLVPDDAEQLSRLARSMGFRPDARGDARAVFESEWALHSREVRRLHEKLFYRPLLDAVARVPSDQLRLTPAEAGRRLAALGYADPAGALRHIGALTSGVSRRAAIQRALLPVLLGDFADAPDPDGGLLAYRRISEALGATPWYLRLLRDEGAVASRLAYLLGASRYVAEMLGRAPEALQLLADDGGLAPRTAGELAATMTEAAARHTDPGEAVLVIRGLRRQELLRIAFADLLGRIDVAEVCAGLAAVTDATLDAALQVAKRAVAEERGLASLPLRFAVIAMGRLGGDEVGYGSDADVMFVYDESAGSDAARIAHEIAERMRQLLSAPSGDPPLHVDANLRPEGRNGPLVRSLASYREYYSRWSSLWEAQALLRARFAVGDADLGREFVALIDPIRYPADGLSTAELAEIRRIKGRVDSERLPRGADPTLHTKLGRGGLADVEWMIQLLQLRYAAAVPGLRTTETLTAIRAAAATGLLADADAAAVGDGWTLATRTRNAIMLARDKAEDQLPRHGTWALVAVGRALGYPSGFDPGQLVDDYRRVTRRARKVIERVFYGD